MAEPNKQTIYIDVDDEITSIVEKVRNADHKILALVLPKRMATLQSIVNMKLLKRTADEADKKVVLITSEAGLLPLAGAVKLHVAKTLQSKPAIPPPPKVESAKEIVADDPGEDSDDVDKAKTVGELAGMTAVAASAKDDLDEDTIDVDSIDDEPAAKSKSKNKKSKLKVPNFDKFRTRLFIAGGVLVALIIGWIVANKILPKATVTIKTNSVDVNANVTFTANTDQKTLDVPNSVVPAVQQIASSSSSQNVPATGKKNVGDPSTGNMTLTNCINDGAAHTVPAGTTFTDGVHTFKSDNSVTLDPALFSGSVCKSANFGLSKTVSVTASQGGAANNVAAQSYSCSINGILSSGSAMTGGTDKTVTIVSQADIDNAKQKANQDNSKVKDELNGKFKELNLYALTATLQPGKQTITPSTKVGDEATDVTVKFDTEYSMLGVKSEDIEKLIDNFAKGQINTKQQKISDYGLDQATVTINTTKSPTNQTMSLQTTATAGASIDINALKDQIKGKKSGDVKLLIGQLPSVQDVNVALSPFWVSKVPGNSSKITIIVQKQQTTSNDTSKP